MSPQLKRFLIGAASTLVLMLMVLYVGFWKWTV